MIFFDKATRGAHSLLYVRFTGTKEGTDRRVMVIDDLLKLIPASTFQLPGNRTDACANTE